MKKSYLLCSLLFLLIGCSLNSQKKFETLLSNQKELNETIKVITDFEIANPNDFESKLFLADYYIASEDYVNAEIYLKRAEKVKKHAPHKNKKENLSKLYAYLARISFINKEYESVITYGKKSLKYNPTTNYSISYLIGHAYVVMDKNEEALKVFDTEYQKYPDKASPDDLQAYMYLLNDAERINECINIIEQYVKTGKWFYGLGAFCSGVYEKAGNIQESLLYAFLDYEYYSSLYEANDSKFIENLNNVEATLKKNNQYEIAEPIMKLILGLYKDVDNYEASITKNFISDYLLIRNKINKKNVTQIDFNILIEMEPYFSSFPIYYWSIWNCVKILDYNSLKNYLPVLKKVIALNPSSVYSELARNEIAKVFGIKITENTDLDLLLF